MIEKIHENRNKNIDKENKNIRNTNTEINSIKYTNKTEIKLGKVMKSMMEKPKTNIMMSIIKKDRKVVKSTTRKTKTFLMSRMH